MNEHAEHKLAEAISSLTAELREWGIERTNNHLIHQWILQAESNIMSKISEFATVQKAFNDRQGAAIDTLVTATQGLTDDVKGLNDKITELQNSQGTVTPADQALIDDLQIQGSALAARLEGVSASLAALDALTPPVVPPPTP